MESKFRHYVKYTFLKVHPEWRRLPAEERAQHKREFMAACQNFAEGHLLRSFSTVGTRGDCDIAILTQAENLATIQEFHAVLNQSGLMKWADIAYSFLAMTKESEYSDETRLELGEGNYRWAFIYPFVKKREWYTMAPDERWKIMQEHINVGKEFPMVDIGTAYSFGLDDQEFLLTFEAENPADFLDLVHRLRTTEASAWTERDTPTFTCLECSLERALGALDGEVVSAIPLS